MSKTPNELARDFLNAAQQNLDRVDLNRCDPDSAALFWALSSVRHAVEQVLAIVEATDPVLAATGAEEPEAAGPGGEEEG